MKTRLQVVFAILFLSSCFCVAANPPTLALGSKAPDFDLPGVDGRNWRLEDFAEAKILVVLFTANHCPTAQYYEERLKKLAADYRDRGVTLVAISPNAPGAVRPDELGYTDLGDSLEDMKIRARHREFNFPYLFGGGEHEAVSLAYGPVATPHVFIFDERRVLRYQGRIDDAEREALMKQQDTRRALDALLQGQEPPVTQTKVFGCSVKWSSKAEGVRDYWERIAKEPLTLDAVDAEGLKALRKNAASSDEPAKFRLINVWATWCGPCVTEFPDLMMIHRMYRQRPFELVTLAAQYPDEREDVLRFLEKQQASNRNLMFGSTEKYALMEAFDPEWQGALPYTILVNPEGEVVYRRQGAVDALELKRLILKELNQRKPW